MHFDNNDPNNKIYLMMIIMYFDNNSDIMIFHDNGNFCYPPHKVQLSNSNPCNDNSDHVEWYNDIPYSMAI